MDTDEEGLRRIVVSNWKIKAANRMEWRSFDGAVKAGTRL
jgi:hypothetical protein